MALALASPLSMAAGGSYYAAGGSYFYGAVDLGQGKLNNFCNSVPAGVSCKNSDSSYRLSAGYQFISTIGNEGFGVEGSYVNNGKASFSGSGVAADMKDTELQLAAIGTLPLTERFTVISKAGVAFWNLKTTSTPATSGLSPNGSDFIWGLGGQFEVSKSFVVRGMFDTHMIGNSVTGRNHLPTLSIGAMFRY